MLAAWLGCTLPVPAAVEIDGDLLLGIWSQQRTRFVANVPACVYTEDGAAGGAYRITVSGGASGTRFAMANDVGDTIPYRLRWYGSRGTSRREELSPGVPSRRAYAFRERAACLDGNVPELEAQARTRDVSRAPPGVYRDTLLLTVSPI